MEIARATAALRASATGEIPKLRVSGRSMWPLVRPNDAVLVDPSAPLAPGDIVVCRAAGRLRVHRLVAMLPEGRWVARGDLCLRADPPIAPASILGRVAAIERSGGRRVDVRCGMGHVLATVLPAIERAAPAGMDRGRRWVLYAMGLADRAWTVQPLRRLRRLRPLRFEVAVAGPRDAAALDAHCRRGGLDPFGFCSSRDRASGRASLCVFARIPPSERIVASTRVTRHAAPDAPEAARLHDAFVERRFRGHGLGAAVVRRALEEVAHTWGACQVRTAVGLAEVRWPRLLEGLGFEPAGLCGGRLVLARPGPLK